MLIYRSILIDLSVWIILFDSTGCVCVQYWIFYHQWWVCKVCNGNISSPLALSCHVLDFYIKMFQVIRGDFVLSTRITGLNWLEYLWLEGMALLKYHVFYEEYDKNEQVTNSKEYYRLKKNIKGLVHPKMKILSLITLMSFQTHKTSVHLGKIFLMESESSLTLHRQQGSLHGQGPETARTSVK